MKSTALPVNSLARPSRWLELVTEIETGQEVKCRVRCYAERDMSTGTFELMDADVEAVELVFAGCRVMLTVEELSRADRPNVVREVEDSWSRIEEEFVRLWESQQGWDDPE